jgi:hypothetical protein
MENCFPGESMTDLWFTKLSILKGEYCAAEFRNPSS